jgi:hypothetical protein
MNATNATIKALETLSKSHQKFLGKGGLCVGLVITRTAKQLGLPLNPISLRTEEGGQVTGLGRAAVQRILEEHGIKKTLAEEGGRTNRGSLGLMEIYVNTLNGLHNLNQLDLSAAERWWIDKVRAHFASEGPKFHFDPGKSLRSNIEDLLTQAAEVQSNSGGTNYVGAMLQHLVGAKLDIVLGEGKIKHHGFSVADHSTDRRADFEISAIAIHVTTHPTEALIRKCEENLKTGLTPLIVTCGEGVAGALFLLAKLADRVDVLDAIQFLTANVYERSLFKAIECKLTLTSLLARYNEIVAHCETDPAMRISIKGTEPKQ